MKLSKRHIVFFTPGFPADENDGSCLPTVQNFVRCFASGFQDWKVTVLSLHYPFKKDRYPWHGVEVVSLGGRNRSYPSRLLLWRKALKELKRIDRKQKVDLIHSFWMHECAMLGSRFATKNRIPLVVTLMGQDLRPPNHFVRLVNQKAATLVALSGFQPERQKTGIREPDAVIPFGIPEAERKWLKPSPKTIDVLGIGSLIALKNYGLFLQVIAILKKYRLGLQAKIIGEGVYRPHIQEMIAKLGLQENVELAGELSRKEIYAQLGWSRVLLHTSDYETQGYVFNEALLAGVPIVSTPVGISREESFWKTAHSPQELAGHVRFLWENQVEVPPSAKLKMGETTQLYADLYMRSLRSRATSAATKK